MVYMYSINALLSIPTIVCIILHIVTIYPLNLKFFIDGYLLMLKKLFINRSKKGGSSNEIQKRAKQA